MIGGVSHLESFDPKPLLNKYAGKSIAETPLQATCSTRSFSTRTSARSRPTCERSCRKLYPLQVGYSKRGESGIEVSDWWPHVGGCVDDLAVIRSMWTNDIDHGAQLQFHTGRNMLDGYLPHDRLVGPLRPGHAQRKPAAVRRAWAAPSPIAAAARKRTAPTTSAPSTTACRSSPIRPIRSPTAARRTAFSAKSSRPSSTCSSGSIGSHWPSIRTTPRRCARIKSYELAFRMQRAVPEVFEFQQETAATHKLYGLDNETTAPFAKHCLAARRLVERGVRFVQIYHGGNGNAGGWDAHGNLRGNHAANCAEVDQADRRADSTT